MVHAASARFERATAEAQYIATLRAERPWLVQVPQIVLARHDPALLIDGIVANLSSGVAHHG